MKPQPIGILGGAGPTAGVLLLERVFSLSSSRYGCYRDSDFPRVIFLSFPFTEMLTPEMDAAELRKELSECLNQLRNNGAVVLAIACNTLHAFLEEDEVDLVHLPKVLTGEIPPGEIPLVLCTSTSVRFGVHNRFFPCQYPDPQTQTQVDQLIDRILGGADIQLIANELSIILESLNATTIILGCTELSLIRNLCSENKLILDPLEIVANKLVEISFTKTRR